MTDTQVECDQYFFDFTDALRAFKFDETQPSMPYFHGAPMKAVDVVAEFSNAYVFVEIKDYNDQTGYDPRVDGTDDEVTERRRQFKWLKNYLKYKYRDTFLYRHAEGKVDKEVHYVCLVNFDTPLNNFLMKQLKPELPVGKKSQRWINTLAKSCVVVNVNRWESSFPKWIVKRMVTE